ncbi:hypothetical protein M434DRAFT_29263 [Hypoxylon sp. CO27-5]|nr:hypothetical protein M434DRAFT_29263 [Hypoxylon sp. CO27-5]
MATEPKSRGVYTIGWITALPKEQTAATAMLDQIHPDLDKTPNDHNIYTLGSIGGHNVVIACLPKGKLGTSSAATVATRMVTTFHSIKAVLLVGIGGGIPPNVRLGDVVISTPVNEYPGVVQWDFGKAEKDGKFKRTGSLNNPPSALLTALTNRKVAKASPKYTSSGLLKDPLSTQAVGEDYGERKDVRVHYGLIASGNQTIKDSELRDSLNNSLGGHVLCVEMEAAGLMNDFPCIVIRGICDYADSQKNKDWQEYAAAVAAGCAKELLGYVTPIEVCAERPVRGLLNNINAKIEALDSKLNRNENLEVLKWLSPINYATQQSDLRERRQPGTSQWFLRQTEYQIWLRTLEQTLFCPGIPGGGKTNNSLRNLLRKPVQRKSPLLGSVGNLYNRAMKTSAQPPLDEMYLDGNMSGFPRFSTDSPDLQRNISNEIAQATEGMFLLASLYLDSIKDKTSKREMIDALKEFKKRNEREPGGGY